MSTQQIRFDVNKDIYKEFKILAIYLDTTITELINNVMQLAVTKYNQKGKLDF